VAVGKICAQSPEADEMVNEGETITFYISKGKETNTVPNVVGSTKEVAEQYLDNAGFEIAYAEEQYSDETAGMVIHQNPVGGTTLDRGSTVTLTLSKGPEPVTVPDLSGLTRDAAISKLQSLDLKVSFAEQVTTDAALIDKVVNQDPSMDNSVTKGTTVTVYLGVKPPD
jgi:serine/threonine-protein kinase